MNGDHQATPPPIAASRPPASSVFLGTDAHGLSFVCDAGGPSIARGPPVAPVVAVPALHAGRNNTVDRRLLSIDDVREIQAVVEEAGEEKPLAYKAMQLCQHAIAMEYQMDMERKRYEASLSESAHALAELQVHVASLPDLYATREKLQRDRWQVETDQLHSQAQALATKLVTGGRVAVNSMELPQTWQGSNDAVYAFYRPVAPPEISTDIRLLKSDIRHLQRKLRDSEARAARMDEEVRRFRALILNGTPLVATDAEVTFPPLPQPSTSSTLLPPLNPRKSRLPLMGDAEAEHLLIAGKKLSHVRRINRVSISSAIVSQAEAIVANGGLAPPRPPPKAPAKRPSTSAGTVRTPPASPSKARKSSTPLQPSSLGPAVATSPGSAAQFFGGIDDLLNAAQSVSNPVASSGETPLDTAAGPSGTKRRRLSDVEEDGVAPMEGKGKERATPSPDKAVEGSSDWFSALDVLADQAASQQAVPSVSPSPTPPPTSILPLASAVNGAERHETPVEDVDMNGSVPPRES